MAFILRGKVIIFIVLLYFQTVKVVVSQKIALDPSRLQLLQDALGWMTFRKNGQLMTNEELEPEYLQPLIQKYTTSKYYRTFVIAFQFQHGVLPRMTLNENDQCDPAYTLEYRDPTNNAHLFTWYYQKKFTFDSFDKMSNGRQYCDYRQGLVCSPATKKCECPDGAKMEPMDSGSQEKRCLLQEDEICALIDTAHVGDHSSLQMNLYHLVFNLEKPPSCKPGTQCRFVNTDKTFSRCHSSSKGLKFIGSDDGWSRKFGDECVLGLYADPGGCTPPGPKDSVGSFKNHICFDFGPSATEKASNPHAKSKTGFCAHEYGRYGIADRVSESTNAVGFKKIHYSVFFTPYVTPRTVPLRGDELKDYFNKYLYKLPNKLDNDVGGGKCSVSNTNEFEDVWKYYLDLEGTPPPGEDFVAGATKAELDAKIQKAIDLVSSKAKVCRVFSYLGMLSIYDSYKCVADGNPADGDGNDGKCEKPGVLTTKPDVEKFKQFLQRLPIVETEEKEEESNYRKEILTDYPEPPCMPSLGPLPPQQLGRHHNPETLEGGYCPDGSICYEDFSDAHGQFDSNCDLQSTKQLLVCHDISKTLGNCEKDFMNKKVKEALANLDQYGKLEKGDACHFSFEKAVRDNDETALAKINLYEIMNWLGRDILCDKTRKNLECTSTGTCECIGGECPVDPGTGQGTRAPPTTGAAGIPEIVNVNIMGLLGSLYLLRLL